MSLLKNTLTEAMKDAMRAKAKFRLGVIRMVLADIKRVEVDERIEVDDARCLSIIDKMTKQRRDAANQFVDGGRQDLADTELAEVEILHSRRRCPHHSAPPPQPRRPPAAAADRRRGVTGRYPST